MGISASTLEHFFYFSRLAPTASAACIADILRTARPFNARHELTGVLIFDGSRFCQYLEGGREAVKTLLKAIMQDPRHVDIEVRTSGAISARLFDRWSMAYAHDAEGEVLNRLAEAETHLLIERLQSLLPKLDAEA